MKLKALPERVLVDDIERGDRLIGKIWIPNDNGRSAGIRPRWAHVYSVGEGITEIQVGQWVLVNHAQWTRGFDIVDDDGNAKTIWQINWPSEVLAVADTPEGYTFSDFSN